MDATSGRQCSPHFMSSSTLCSVLKEGFVFEQFVKDGQRQFAGLGTFCPLNLITLCALWAYHLVFRKPSNLRPDMASKYYSHCIKGTVHCLYS